MRQFFLSVVCEFLFSEEVHVNINGLVVKKLIVIDFIVTFQPLSLLRSDEYSYASWPAFFNIHQFSVCAMGGVNESAE